MERLELKEAKAALRLETLKQRDAEPKENRDIKSDQICSNLLELDYIHNASTIAAYLPIRSEVDLRGLISALKSMSKKVALPVIINPQTINFRIWEDGKELFPSGFGTIGPGSDASIVDPDLMIMPLAVFDKYGNRIGYGAGHYDRAIDAFNKRGIFPKLVGVAFSLQQRENIPTDAHDKPLDLIITEDKQIVCM